jgi:F-type H+-transporting ATPase subunit epsilon
MAENTFQCSVVTPEEAVLDTQAQFVAFPAHDGEIGILPGRSPLLCRLGIGSLRVRTEEGEKTLFIDGGFAQMVDNRLTILTEQAKDPSELDHEEAKLALREAEKTIASDERGYKERQAALERARVQMRMTERKGLI